VLLSQDEARFPMVPPLTATLGVKGRRPEVGTWDNKGLLYVPAVVNPVTAAVHANTPECPGGAKRKAGKGKNRRLTEAFAAHLRHVGRVYPREEYRRVVPVIGNAPWHAGKPVGDALRDNPHPEFKRLPPYSPSLNPIERFRRVLRRRATHNRLFDTLSDPKRSLRNSLSHFQTVRARVAPLVEKSFRPKATPSAAP
jgi:transposase